ncbi:hypothetical protein [Photobacterium satsumensis]|uniref:hypothetical protein n=1 Tax=Photobacterium satsumensis TaxID=2910239 RepID=UPI003D09C7A6
MKKTFIASAVLAIFVSAGATAGIIEKDTGGSVSGTINQTTGSYSDFSSGAGVQYAF